MLKFKRFICAVGFCLVAGRAAATVYPVSVDFVFDMLGMDIPIVASGVYDDYTGTGDWTMSVDLAAFGAGSISFDQEWIMNSVTGAGELYRSSACVGDVGACIALESAFSGVWSADITPVGYGQYIFSLNSASIGLINFEVTIGDPQPGVRVNLAVASSDFECVNGGALIEASSSVTLLNEAELESLVWSVDGQPIAGTESISEYLTLGQHTLQVVATITTGDQATDEAIVTVVDTAAPVINAFFSHERTGEVLTSIDSNNTSFVLANFGASDACDASPVVQGFGGFELGDGQRLKVQGQHDKVELKTSVIEMLVKATDASGNSTELIRSLSITP